MAERRGSKENRLKNFRKVEPSEIDIFNFDFGEIDLSGIDLEIDSFMDSDKLFMSRFSEKDIINTMESIGLLQHLESMGFSVIHVDIDKDENYINHLRLFWEDKTPENQLLDLRVSEHTFIPEERFFEEDFKKQLYHMVLIEWLSARNPLAVFDENRPQLPGQRSPGLGILKYCFELLNIISSEVFKDGFLDIPTHMHGAIMYSKKFKFFDPIQEAVLRAVMRDLRNHSLVDISWGVITETIIDLQKDRPAVYDPGEQIHYVSPRMKRYFESRKYVNTFNKFYRRKKYYFNYKEMVRKRKEILLAKKVEDL